MSDAADKYRAPALDKGLDILEFLAASSVGLTQAEIAKGLGRGPNEIYRMLDTLVRRNYVTRTPDGDKYMLSLRLLVIANMHPPRRRLLDIADIFGFCARKLASFTAGRLGNRSLQHWFRTGDGGISGRGDAFAHGA